MALPRHPRHAFRKAICCSSRSEEHTSELQSLRHLVCRLLLEKKKKKTPHKTAQATQTVVVMLTNEQKDHEVLESNLDLAYGTFTQNYYTHDQIACVRSASLAR